MVWNEIGANGQRDTEEGWLSAKLLTRALLATAILPKGEISLLIRCRCSNRYLLMKPKVGVEAKIEPSLGFGPSRKHGKPMTSSAPASISFIGQRLATVDERVSLIGPGV